MNYQCINSVWHVFSDLKDDRNTFNIELIYTRGGSWFEGAQDRGRMHLLEHCICSHPANMNFEQFKDLAFKESITYNAYTSASELALEAKGHKNDFKLILDIFLDMFVYPSINEADLDREKEIVLTEIKDRQGDPQYKLWQDVSQTLFLPNSLSQHEVLGDYRAVQTTTLKDFERLHMLQLDQSPFVLKLSGGGIDLKYLHTKVNLFTNIGNKYSLDPIFRFPNELKNMDAIYLQHEFGHEEANLILYIPTIIEYHNRPTREVFTKLFLQSSGVGLYDRLRDQLGLIYGYYFNYDIDGQYLVLDLNCELTNINQILVEIDTYFANFEAIFNENKFVEYCNQIIKKQDLLKDKASANIDFAYHNWHNFGVVEDLEEFAIRLKLVNKEDLQKYFESISSSLKMSKKVVISRQPKPDFLVDF